MYQIVFDRDGWTDDFINSEFAIYEDYSEAKNGARELCEFWKMEKGSTGIVPVVNGDWDIEEVERVE